MTEWLGRLTCECFTFAKLTSRRVSFLILSSNFATCASVRRCMSERCKGTGGNEV